MKQHVLRKTSIIVVALAMTIALMQGMVAGQISTGMAAHTAVGQPTLDDNTPGLDDQSFDRAASVLVDEVHQRLYVADTLNHRVLVFDLNADGSLVDNVADHVLGQPDFLTNTAGTSQNTMAYPFGLAIDVDNNYLFVSSAGGEPNNRVLVFDVGTITNGENAINVLGQPDFVTSTYNVGTAWGMARPMALAYDDINDRLFVADRENNRVMVFELAGGITDGMDASYFIGQTGANDVQSRITQEGLSWPRGVSYDSVNDRLYVADQSNVRVMVYELASGVSNFMPATYVLGQPDFVTNLAGTTDSTMLLINHLEIDPSHDLLYVTDQYNNRVMVWDVVDITNGEAATYVLGQPDFVTADAGVSATAINQPQGVSFNALSGDLVVADRFNNRVLLYDVAAGDSDLDGTDDSVEDSFPNGGDTNDDGTPDSQQDTVTAVENPVTTAHTTVESSEPTCPVDNFNVLDEASLPVQDPTADYPVGINDFTLDCVGVGSTVDLVIYYDQLYDTSSWSYKKFDPGTQTYVDITSYVTFGSANIGGTDVTTVSYQITDGGDLDQDGVANGAIVDPAGPSAPPVAEPTVCDLNLPWMANMIDWIKDNPKNGDPDLLEVEELMWDALRYVTEDCVSDSFIQGKVFRDLNQNGIFDTEEKVAANKLDGRTVELFNMDWTLVNSMLTGDDNTPAGNVAKGQYRFSELPIGHYYVCQVPVIGEIQTNPYGKILSPTTGLDCFDIKIVNFEKHKTGKKFGVFEL